jgi:AcrR family transcriptional regulator
VGRPKQHDEHTAVALLDVAERIVERDGIGALSVRAVAAEAGSTTRAVYSLFGSKDGLVVALGDRAFGLLGAAIDALPATASPDADLVDAGVTVFRRFALDHPSLFSIAIQKTSTESGAASGFERAAGEALDGLRARVARVESAGLLGDRSVEEATFEFHALCEGLAALELRGILSPGTAERIWRDALGSLVTGFRSQVSSGGN